MRKLVLCSTLCLVVLPYAGAQMKPKVVSDQEPQLTAEQSAATINALPTFKRIQAIMALSANGKPLTDADTAELFALNQSLLQKATTVSLEVDATTSEIDAEIAETRELEGYLIGKRQQTIDMLNLASLGIGGALGTSSAALGLTIHGKSSSVLGLLAGATAVTFSIVNLSIRNRQKAELEVPSNMLSRVFDLPGSANNIYPAVVAHFMNSPAPVDPDGLTREQRLLHDWTKVGRLPADPKASHDKMARLSSRPGDNVKLSIGDLDDRQNMLYDFRARISFLKRDLAVLVEAMPEVPLPAR
jgi:hypothetical protein